MEASGRQARAFVLTLDLTLKSKLGDIAKVATQNAKVGRNTAELPQNTADGILDLALSCKVEHAVTGTL